VGACPFFFLDARHIFEMVSRQKKPARKPGTAAWQWTLQKASKQNERGRPDRMWLFGSLAYVARTMIKTTITVLYPDSNRRSLGIRSEETEQAGHQKELEPA